MAAVSKSAAASEVAASFPDNTIGTITPTGARAVFQDFIDSWVDTLTPGNSTGTMIYWPAASTSPVSLGLGSAGAILQAGATAPAWLSLGSAGSILQAGSSAPSWLAAGARGSLLFETSASSAAWLALGGTGSVLQPAAGTAPAWVTSPVIGNPGTTPGTLGLAGSNATSTVTLAANASGASFTFRFPPSGGSSGQVLSTDGTGSTSWIAAAAVSGASGTVLVGVAGTGSTFTASPLLGVAGTTPGTLGLAGSNSTSTVTLAANASGASWTMRLPISGGTNQFLLSTDGSGVTSWVNGAQIPGTVTSDNASSGNIGEFVSTAVTVAGAITLTSVTTSNVASMSLTAGDWDSWGNFALNPGATTTVTQFDGWISPSSATVPSVPNSGAFLQLLLPFTAGSQQVFPVGQTRLSLSTTTTIFLSGLAGFTGTCSLAGFIGARRRR